MIDLFRAYDEVVMDYIGYPMNLAVTAEGKVLIQDQYHNFYVDPDTWEMDAPILEMYSGKKDTNEEPIYENDIVEFDGTLYHGQRGAIINLDGDFFIHIKDYGKWTLNVAEYCRFIKVVGTTHD